MPPEKHALLSASSASRWLKCTAAPRFEEHLPERTSEYAEEGRLAHAICELKTLKKFTVMTSRTYTTRLNKLKKDPLYSEEMDKTSDLYIEHLIEQAMLYDSTPTVVAEVQVDFGEYVPEGFGTCDNVMIGGDTLSITDYKHGKGVPVSAVGNPQMRLYALGALKRYAPVFGDAIKKVRMSIDQPRLDSYTTDTITVEELMAWGENIKPIAQKAFSGLGEFVPGDHCRFCRGKAQCRARANTNTALEDFKDCVPAASVPPDAMAPQEFSHIGPHGNEVHPLLSDAEIGDLLIRGKELVAWYKDLEEYATKALLDGDDALRESAAAAEREIDQKERDIENLCMKLLLQQQPVARDLRAISAALKMISDMERIGDQAADIAEITLDIAHSPMISRVPIAEMARNAIVMVTDSIDSFVRKNLSLAQAVVRRDDEVDQLFLDVKQELVRLLGQGDSGEVCIDLLMIAKYLERIGDHAVNIAEWVEYSLTGQHSALN